ncbi:helix-hairpin-helix domain-containing protein [Pseudarthrobacter sp. LT1]|uniref:helix-hairpin-helix domain-containing protein n=1 Tax=Pseudarthrobacter sp. LT1 TaxID=3111450 RepID=UPI002D7972FC|nr:helix-hairpin-helix domain-containing protein [Pseudarthrobacter sp. LT1]WRT12054.1 helix-hairpin-helix domain-containing protein [Pseudarthrobacter sp. LT1]
MSRRDAAATGQQARPVRARLQAALGEATAGVSEDDLGLGGFEYRGPAETSGAPGAVGPECTSSTAPTLRWRVGLRVALLLAALAAAACAWFWWQAAAAAPEVLPLAGVGSGTTAETQERGNTPHEAEADQPDAGPHHAESAPAALLVVHVAGAVAKPGVVRLQQGSRVEDAIAAAGGALPEADANQLNLALVMEDGQKIVVPLQGEPATAPPYAPGSGGSGADTTGTQGSGGSTAGEKVNLNTADVAMLDTLPKVGPVLAQRIVDWRKDHGPFKSVEELDAVDGVGPKLLEALLPLVTV